MLPDGSWSRRKRGGAAASCAQIQLLKSLA
jgi:hypothetical protein